MHNAETERMLRNLKDDDLPLYELKNHNRRLNGLGTLVSRLQQWIWQISTAVLLCTTLALLYKIRKMSSNTYENGFATDLKAITQHIELEKVVFTNEIELSADGHLVRVPGDGPQYVGDPSPEIDEAWANMLEGLNMDLSGEEANDIRGETYQWPGSDVFYSGVDVFHSLHCLNEIRKALHPDYYAVKENITDAAKRVGNVHIEHCLDYVRQTVQCGADLTPMNWAWIDKTQKIFFKPGTVHTCRNFEQIQKWTAERKVNWDSEEKHGFHP
ncbi:hypothetical protein F5884DRAFT_769085 [Xylogone sp. PMI_703]|nr:hypothetical protein F5884DRAFT_769085 [Xylogone sp. PMI_703]